MWRNNFNSQWSVNDLWKTVMKCRNLISLNWIFQSLKNSIDISWNTCLEFVQLWMCLLLKTCAFLYFLPRSFVALWSHPKRDLGVCWQGQVDNTANVHIDCLEYMKTTWAFFRHTQSNAAFSRHLVVRRKEKDVKSSSYRPFDW